jgi:hypothetical protein
MSSTWAIVMQANAIGILGSVVGGARATGMMAELLARSQAVVLLTTRSSFLRKAVLAAETARNAVAQAEAQDELDRIGSAIDILGNARPSPNIDLDRLDGEAVAHFEAAISQL